MTLNFFAMLYTLSIVELSLAAPATASLTYVGNAFAGKIFLRENVDKRRWFAAIFVCVGVFFTRALAARKQPHQPSPPNPA